VPVPLYVDNPLDILSSQLKLFSCLLEYFWWKSNRKSQVLKYEIFCQETTWWTHTQSLCRM